MQKDKSPQKFRQCFFAFALEVFSDNAQRAGAE
jgi:hypothetical protein